MYMWNFYLAIAAIIALTIFLTTAKEGFTDSFPMRQWKITGWAKSGSVWMAKISMKSGPSLDDCKGWHHYKPKYVRTHVATTASRVLTADDITKLAAAVSTAFGVQVDSTGYLPPKTGKFKCTVQATKTANAAAAPAAPVVAPTDATAPVGDTAAVTDAAAPVETEEVIV